MSPLARLRRAPWIGAALILALAAGLAAPVAYALGARRWPLFVALAAVLLLLLGGLERLRRRRPLPGPPPRPATPQRLRVVRGGKGNGRPHDHDTTDDDGEKPRWLM
jgi:hypothetical protein